MAGTDERDVTAKATGREHLVQRGDNSTKCVGSVTLWDSILVHGVSDRDICHGVTGRRAHIVLPLCSPILYFDLLDIFKLLLEIKLLTSVERFSSYVA